MARDAKQATDLSFPPARPSSLAQLAPLHGQRSTARPSFRLSPFQSLTARPHLSAPSPSSSRLRPRPSRARRLFPCALCAPRLQTPQSRRSEAWPSHSPSVSSQIKAPPLFQSSRRPQWPLMAIALGRRHFHSLSCSIKAKHELSSTPFSHPLAPQLLILVHVPSPSNSGSQTIAGHPSSSSSVKCP